MLINTDARRLDLLGIDRMYGANVITSMGVMLLKGERPGEQSSLLGTLPH